jgi:hypothetical protein
VDTAGAEISGAPRPAARCTDGACGGTDPAGEGDGAGRYEGSADGCAGVDESTLGDGKDAGTAGVAERCTTLAGSAPRNAAAGGTAADPLTGSANCWSTSFADVETSPREADSAAPVAATCVSDKVSPSSGATTGLEISGVAAGTGAAGGASTAALRWTAGRSTTGPSRAER